MGSEIVNLRPDAGTGHRLASSQLASVIFVAAITGVAIFTAVTLTLDGQLAEAKYAFVFAVIFVLTLAHGVLVSACPADRGGSARATEYKGRSAPELRYPHALILIQLLLGTGVSLLFVLGGIDFFKTGPNRASQPVAAVLCFGVAVFLAGYLPGRVLLYRRGRRPSLRP
jgi:hypothetical protein